MTMESSLGRVIHIGRYDKGITQKDLAKKMKISPSYLSLMEQNKEKMPSKSILRKLAKYLDLDYYDLLYLSSYTGQEVLDFGSEYHLTHIIDKMISVLMENKIIGERLEAVSLYLEQKLTPESLSHIERIDIYRDMHKWTYCNVEPDSARGIRKREVDRHQREKG